MSKPLIETRDYTVFVKVVGIAVPFAHPNLTFEQAVTISQSISQTGYLQRKGNWEAGKFDGFRFYPVKDVESIECERTLVSGGITLLAQ